jgi:hypothetical protein
MAAWHELNNLQEFIEELRCYSHRELTSVESHLDDAVAALALALVKLDGSDA